MVADFHTFSLPKIWGKVNIKFLYNLLGFKIFSGTTDILCSVLVPRGWQGAAGWLL